MIPGSHLLPLVSKDLRRLTISPCTACDMIISDEELPQLFSAWPRLEEFCLESEDNIEEEEGYYDSYSDDDELGRGDPLLTLADVANALHLCPHLKALALRCDARDVPSANTSVPQISLASWDVGASPIKSGAAFAEWARRTCPNLTTINSFSQMRSSMSWMSDFFNESEERSEESKADVILLIQWNDAARMLARRS
jgi:hypothetical protein